MAQQVAKLTCERRPNVVAQRPTAAVSQLPSAKQHPLFGTGRPVVTGLWGVVAITDWAAVASSKAKRRSACAPICPLAAFRTETLHARQRTRMGPSPLNSAPPSPDSCREENHPARGGRNAPGNAPGEKWENRKNGGKWGKMGENGGKWGDQVETGGQKQGGAHATTPYYVYNLRSTSCCKINYCRLPL